MQTRIVLGLAFVAGSAMSCGALAANYTAGNLVLTQVGPGSGTGGALNSFATAVTLREFSPSGASFVANDLSLPSTGPDKLLLSGIATSEGMLTLSTDQRYLTLGGYDAIVGQQGANVNSSIATSANFTGASTTIVNRMVGRVDVSQNTSLYRMTNAYSGSNFRSVASSDGSTFHTSGTASTNPNQAVSAGVRLFDPSAGSDSTQLGAPPTNIRVVNLALGGRVFGSAQSAPFNGISEWSGGAAVLLPGMASTFVTNDLAPTDFVFIDSDTLYVADEGVLTGTVGTPPKNRVGGLQRWEFDGANWNLQYRITGNLTAGLRGLCATVDLDGNPVFYATSADTLSKLVTVTDTGLSTDTSSALGFTLLATAATNQAFRGVDFAPIPAPGAGILLGIGALVAARRRRA